MKVKCIKTSISSENKLISNSKMDDYLKKGQEFIVFGLQFELLTNYVLIYVGRHLILVPFELFKIIDKRIPSNWIIRNHQEIIDIYPKFFHDEDFFDNFSDCEKKERDLFEELMKNYDTFLDNVVI
jgi:hypothetical protein